MDTQTGLGNYLRQNGANYGDYDKLTPRQRRRLQHKSARMQFGNAGGARLRKRHERRLRIELAGRVRHVFGRGARGKDWSA